jgi:hypothetical protein
MTARFDPRSTLRSDLLLVVALIALDVAARLLPHSPNFTPVAASALFAGTVLGTRALAFAVPLGAMLISDAVIGFDGSAMTLLIYALFTLPACVAFLPRRARAPGMFVPAIIAYSLLFFAVTNLAVWAFSGMYPMTVAGLATCYAAALPFLPQTVIGDLFWAAVLFGGYALLHLAPRMARHSA